MSSSGLPRQPQERRSIFAGGKRVGRTNPVPRDLVPRPLSSLSNEQQGAQALFLLQAKEQLILLGGHISSLRSLAWTPKLRKEKSTPVRTIPPVQDHFGTKLDTQHPMPPLSLSAIKQRWSERKLDRLPTLWRPGIIWLSVLTVMVPLIRLALSGDLSGLILHPLTVISDKTAMLGISILSLIIGRPPSESIISSGELLRATLPMGLSGFWLLVAWLLDSEARRAFTRHEPWGKRLATPYSFLATGCLAPLALAGILLGAWGYVSFLDWTASNWGWQAAIRAGATILLLTFIILWTRNVLKRWWLARHLS